MVEYERKFPPVAPINQIDFNCYLIDNLYIPSKTTSILSSWSFSALNFTKKTVINTILTFFGPERNNLARYLVIYTGLKQKKLKRQDMKFKNVLLVIFTIGLALIPFIKSGLDKHDEFDATQDLFI